MTTTRRKDKPRTDMTAESDDACWLAERVDGSGALKFGAFTPEPSCTKTKAAVLALTASPQARENAEVNRMEFYHTRDSESKYSLCIVQGLCDLRRAAALVKK
jgi:hypothetical protein